MARSGLPSPFMSPIETDAGLVPVANVVWVAYDGVVAPAAWTTGVVDQVCDFKANIIDPNTVSITWNTKAEDPSPEAIAASQSVPFGSRKARSA